MNLSITALITNKPSNVTDAYDDTDNRNCVSVLGDTCVKSLAQAVALGPLPGYQTLDGCESTLTVTGDGFGGGFNFAVTHEEPFYNRGDTLVYHTSQTYKNDNETVFAQSKNALQVLIINPVYGEEGLQSSSDSVSVTCLVVDKTAAVAPEVPDVPDDSGAKVWGASIVPLWVAGLMSCWALL